MLSDSAPTAKFTDYLNLIRWDRPAGTLLLLWPTLCALWIAAEGSPSWHLLLVFSLGTFLMRSAGCCINDIADRNFDRYVERTANRPITSGRISVKQALGVTGLLAGLAFILVLSTNKLTIFLSFFALGITFLYPFTKRFFSMPQAVLGIAFGVGIFMAFSAVQEYISTVTWWLFAGNLAWTLAYDTEYAMVDREDDLKLGLRTSAITLGNLDIYAVLFFYLAFLLCWIWGLKDYHLGLFWYTAIAIAALQVIWHWSLIRTRERMRCFRAFTQNHWLGFTLFVGIAMSLGLRSCHA